MTSGRVSGSSSLPSPPMCRENDVTFEAAPRPARESQAVAGVEHDVGLSVRNINHWYFHDAGATQVLKDINLIVPNRQFIALVGPSGCGKTTLLNLIAGLIRPSRGAIEVAINGEVAALPSPQIGYMWARDALLPWRSLRRNVEFGLEIRGVPRSERTAIAQSMIELVGLGGAERRFPRQLSQGMRQRGNLARLLATKPDFLLMDEPFAAVDAQTKLALQQEFLSIWNANPKTVVYVTHDLGEAALLADRVIVMNRGKICHDLTVPFGRPRDLYELRFDQRYTDFAHKLWLSLNDSAPLEQS